LQAENEFLVKNGFSDVKRNLKALLRNQKNKENALVFLKEKESKKKDHTKLSKEEKNKKFMEEIKKLWIRKPK